MPGHCVPAILTRVSSQIASKEEDRSFVGDYPIVVVDDEPDNLDAFRFNFKRIFKLHTAGSGDEALALLKLHDAAVIVTDQRMPRMTGLEFLKAARAIRPDAVGIIVTA